MSYRQNRIIEFSQRIAVTPYRKILRYFGSAGGQKPFVMSSYFGSTSIDTPIPDAGGTLSYGVGSYGIMNKHRVYGMLFQAPVDCRLTGVGLALNGICSESTYGLTNIRIGVVASPPYTGSFSDTAGYAVWNVLGALTTGPDFSVSTETLKKNVKVFNSSDGDVSAGTAVGMVLQALPQDAGGNCGIHYGLVTMTFETR